MPTFCDKCGAMIEDGRDHCVTCLAPVRRGMFGWVRRLFGGGRTAGSDRSAPATARDARAPDPGAAAPVSVATRRVASPHVTSSDFHVTDERVERSETYRYEDNSTGERGEWHSWDEIPAEIRAKMEAVRAEAGDDIAGTPGGPPIDMDFAGGLPGQLGRILQSLTGESASFGGESRTVRHSSYSYRDSSGVERTYSSLAEMPDDVRRMFEGS